MYFNHLQLFSIKTRNQRPTTNPLKQIRPSYASNARFILDLFQAVRKREALACESEDTLLFRHAFQILPEGYPRNQRDRSRYDQSLVLAVGSSPAKTGAHQRARTNSH